jgi:D-xylose transport system permease protein
MGPGGTCDRLRTRYGDPTARSIKAYGLGEANYGGELLRSILPVGAIIAFIWVMNSYEGKGVPIPVLIFVAVALFGAFMTTSTTFGRYLYAIGGNADAARLSGIDNRRNVLKVYMILGALTGLAALIFAGRVGSATPDAGTLKELDAIAACVIGGASLVGGRGTIFGACLGALIMASLDNGMSLLNVRDFMQDIIKGSILVAAVGLDMFGRKQS